MGTKKEPKNEGTTALATRDENKALQTWEERLAAEAEEGAAGAAVSGGGNFLSIRGGILRANKVEVPGGEIACVVLAYCHARAYYSKEFDPEKPGSPDCYAYGKRAEGMKPFPEVARPIAAACRDCKFDAFKSDKRGKGKACKETFKLALISAGKVEAGKTTLLEDQKGMTAKKLADILREEELYYLSVPTMSRPAWASHVQGLKATVNRPPWAVYTKIRVRPHEKKQVEVTFDPIKIVGHDLLECLRARAQQAEAALAVPFPKPEEQREESAPAKSGKRGKW